MRDSPSPTDWPPLDGRSFVLSEEFGLTLVDLVGRLASNYPHMDFSDAVANVFEWFDGRLRDDPMFLGPPRFPTREAFLAYLRQAVWNAARLTERQRKRHHFVTALPRNQAIIVREIDPEECAELLDAVEHLEEPHKTVFHRYFFDEEDLGVLASAYDLTEDEIYDLYTEAIDVLRAMLLPGQ